jgi:hypothetical protein
VEEMPSMVSEVSKKPSQLQSKRRIRQESQARDRLALEAFMSLASAAVRPQGSHGPGRASGAVQVRAPRGGAGRSEWLPHTFRVTGFAVALPWSCLRFACPCLSLIVTLPLSNPTWHVPLPLNVSLMNLGMPFVLFMAASQCPREHITVPSNSLLNNLNEHINELMNFGHS